MKKLVVLIAAALAVGGIETSTAEAHLVTRPKAKTAIATLKSQEANLAHSRYVCNNGKRKAKSWHCHAVWWLGKEIEETRAKLIPPAPSGWIPVAVCESGRNPPAWHINTGNGFYGGLQFTEGTWLHAQRLAGVYYADLAHKASPAQQMHVAEVLRQREGIGHWPYCGRFFN